MIHSFTRSLRLAEDVSDAPWWATVYQRAFPTMIGTHTIAKDGWAQRGGVDRVVILGSGKVLHIEQKVRAEVWPDILLEYWSSREHRRPGWIAKDALSDYLAYAFLPTHRCYVFDFASLRRVWLHHRFQWVDRATHRIDGFRIVEAANRGYTTVSVAFPITALQDALRTHACIDFSDAMDVSS